MEAYIFIFIAAALFSGQFVFSKLYERNSESSLISNIWMSEFYGLWLVVIFFCAAGFTVNISGKSWMFAILNSLTNIICTAASIGAYRLGKMSTVTLYTLIGGQAVPFVFGIMTGSRPSILCYIGFAIMLISFIPGVLFAPKEESGGKSKLPFYLLCTVTFFSNGFVSVITDLKAKQDSATSSSDFLVATGICTLALSAAVITVLGLIKVQKGESIKKAFFSKINKKAAFVPVLFSFTLVGLYTAFNGIANIFSLRAAGTAGMSSEIQFPILNSAIVVFTSLISRIIFREKQKWTDICGAVLAVAGILFFMLDFLI